MTDYRIGPFVISIGSPTNSSVTPPPQGHEADVPVVNSFRYAWTMNPYRTPLNTGFSVPLILGGHPPVGWTFVPVDRSVPLTGHELLRSIENPENRRAIVEMIADDLNSGDTDRINAARRMIVELNRAFTFNQASSIARTFLSLEGVLGTYRSRLSPVAQEELNGLRRVLGQIRWERWFRGFSTAHELTHAGIERLEVACLLSGYLTTEQAFQSFEAAVVALNLPRFFVGRTFTPEQLISLSAAMRILHAVNYPYIIDPITALPQHGPIYYVGFPRNHVAQLREQQLALADCFLETASFDRLDHAISLPPPTNAHALAVMSYLYHIVMHVASDPRNPASPDSDEMRETLIAVNNVIGNRLPRIDRSMWARYAALEAHLDGRLNQLANSVHRNTVATANWADGLRQYPWALSSWNYLASDHPFFGFMMTSYVGIDAFDYSRGTASEHALFESFNVISWMAARRFLGAAYYFDRALVSRDPFDVGRFMSLMREDHGVTLYVARHFPRELLIETLARMNGRNDTHTTRLLTLLILQQAQAEFDRIFHRSADSGDALVRRYLNDRTGMTSVEDRAVRDVAADWWHLLEIAGLQGRRVVDIQLLFPEAGSDRFAEHRPMADIRATEAVMMSYTRRLSAYLLQDGRTPEQIESEGFDWTQIPPAFIRDSLFLSLARQATDNAQARTLLTQASTYIWADSHQRLRSYALQGWFPPQELAEAEQAFEPRPAVFSGNTDHHHGMFSGLPSGEMPPTPPVHGAVALGIPSGVPVQPLSVTTGNRAPTLPPPPAPFLLRPR